MQSSVDLQFFCIWDPSLLWFEKAPADIMALFSWLQNRHKIHVVGGRPVERSMMSVTLVQSIKCSEVKGNFHSMEKCWCSVHNPHSYSSPSDINCTLFLNVFFFKKRPPVWLYTGPQMATATWTLTQMHWISYRSIVTQTKVRKQTIAKSPLNCRM